MLGAQSKAQPPRAAQTDTALVIGFLRSYENMAKAKVFVDSDLVAEIDGVSHSLLSQSFPHTQTMLRV